MPTAPSRVDPAAPTTRPAVPRPARRGSLFEPLESRLMLSVSLAVAPGTKMQTIDGFGSALYPGAGSLYETSAFQDMYYKDLGSSVVRFEMDPLALVGPNHTLDSAVTLGSDLATDISKFNFGIDAVAAAGAMAKAGVAKGYDGVKVIASVWSPPHWMKGAELDPVSGQPNGNQPALTYYGSNTSGGSLIDTPANLQQFGLYVAAYVKGFQQTYGVPLYAVSIQNELAFHETYDSCVYTPKIYVDALKAVHDAFVAAGITTKIEGPEDVGVGSTTDPWELWRQFQYVNAVRADPAASADLGLYSIHGYANDGITAGRSPAMWGQYWNGRSAQQYPTPAGANWTGISGDGKRSWMTETSGESNDMAGALTLAENAQDAIVQGHASAWVYWQTSDGGATASPQTLTAGTDESAKKFNAARQFFRYVRPGAVQVGVSGSNPTGVYASAFVRDADHTLTAVLINTTGAAQTVNLSVGGLAVSGFNIDRRTDAAENFADGGAVPVTNGVATLTLPAGSVVTLQGAVAGSSIAGTVFNDVNANGARDTGEAALAGVRVYLDQNRNGLLDPGEPSVLTDSGGNYKFSGLFAGTYRVREQTPSGYRVDNPAAGYADVTVAAGQAVAGRAFADTQKVLIAGTVFNDANADGTRQSNESGLGGWTVFLDANGNGTLDAGETRATTDSSGAYRFVVTAGTYHVREVLQAGYRRTTPSSGRFDVTLAAGATAAGELFGDTQNLLLAGTVFNDANSDKVRQSTEAGLAGWRVYVDANNDGIFETGERSVLTDAAGNWSIGSLPAGSYVLRVVQQSGYTRTTPTGSGAYTVSLSSGHTVTGLVFGEHKVA